MTDIKLNVTADRVHKEITAAESEYMGTGEIQRPISIPQVKAKLSIMSRMLYLQGKLDRVTDAEVRSKHPDYLDGYYWDRLD